VLSSLSCILSKTIKHGLERSSRKPRCLHCSNSHARPSPLISSISMVLPSTTCQHQTLHDGKLLKTQHFAPSHVRWEKNHITLAAQACKASVSAFRVNECMQKATFGLRPLVTECTCLCRFRGLGRGLLPKRRAQRTGFGGKSRFHVAVTIIRCWWLKDFLEAPYGGKVKA
jgi:hypothetical protein